MGESAEPLYDEETTRLMSKAYEAADKGLGTSDKAQQVTMAVGIIRAINEGERDPARLAALAVAAVRVDSRPEPEQKDEPKSSTARPGWVNLATLLS